MSKISKTLIDKSDATRPQATTRVAVLDLLKKQGTLSTAELARSFSLTPMAVRLHLLELEAEGLVASEDRANGRGRPTKYWALTDAAARIFPDAHQGLAVKMIKSVEALFGTEGLEKVISRHGDMQRQEYSEQMASAKSVGKRVQRLAQLRTEEGYMAEAKRDGRDWLLIENHCPICSAAKSCTGLCANELQVFTDILGQDCTVAREEHLLSQGRRCVYRVSPVNHSQSANLQSTNSQA